MRRTHVYKLHVYHTFTCTSMVVLYQAQPYKGVVLLLMDVVSRWLLAQWQTRISVVWLTRIQRRWHTFSQNAAIFTNCLLCIGRWCRCCCCSWARATRCLEGPKIAVDWNNTFQIMTFNFVGRCNAFVRKQNEKIRELSISGVMATRDFVIFNTYSLLLCK